MSRAESRAAAVVVAAALVGFVFGASARTYDNHDVSRYAQMAWEMTNGRTLVPTLNGRPYHEAMPLAAWLPLAVARLQGEVTPLTSRLAPALASVALVAATMILAWRRAGPRIGIASGALVLACPVITVYGHQSRIDPVLALAVTAAVLDWSDAAERRDLRRCLGAGIWLAVAIATKGPLAALFVAFAIGPALALERRARPLLAGGAIALVVASALTAAWVVPYFHYLGPAERDSFIDQFLFKENLEKLETGYGKAAPWWNYLVDAPRAFAPWIVASVAALWRVVRRPREATHLERVAAGWALLSILFLSFASGKHIRYLVPEAPAWAILAACELERWLAVPRARAVLSRAALVASSTALIAGVVAPIIFLVRGELDARALFAAACVAVAGASALRASAERRLLAVAVAWAGVCAFLFGPVYALREVERDFPYARLARELASVVPPGEPLAVVDDRDPSNKLSIDENQLALYLRRRVDRARAPRAGWLLVPSSTGEIEWNGGTRWRLERLP